MTDRLTKADYKEIILRDYKIMRGMDKEKSVWTIIADIKKNSYPHEEGGKMKKAWLDAMREMGEAITQLENWNNQNANE